MKNQEEIYKALLAGEILINRGRDRIILKDGAIYPLDNQYANYAFSEPEKWQIYKEPKWYETKEAVGSLCEFWDYDYNCKIIDTFTTTGICNGELSFMPGDTYLSGMYKNARQLTKEEIQIFMDRVPK